MTFKLFLVVVEVLLASGLKQQCPNDLCKMTKERVVQLKAAGGYRPGAEELRAEGTQSY